MTQTNHQPQPYVRLSHPEWSKDAVIYQINTRQFTGEGTFRAAETHLPRLRDLGVDILWLMPIHEIGARNRKGRLGSPYAVKDYYSVNPEFGTLDDLRHFITMAHDLGFHVILDWVANHTACDCVLLDEHPEWYARDWKGEFHPTPWYDWDDVYELDFSQPALRGYMAAAMRYWVEDIDVDGFRCDVAGFVPLDFWNAVRKELDTVKPVFMLAEWESRDSHAEAFDMTYAWSWYDALNHITMHGAPLDFLFRYYAHNTKAMPQDALAMTFVSNHDKNAWEGTQFEAFGAGLEACIVLSVIGEGMPLIYNGQEAGNPRRLSFFEKDHIDWQEHSIGELYRTLIALKKRTPALWNGHWGARMIHVPSTAPEAVFSFVRQDDAGKVFVVLNFSNQRQTSGFKETLCHGTYTDYLTGESVTCDEATAFDLPAWGYRVLVMQ